MGAPEMKPATRPLWVYISSAVFLVAVAAGTLWAVKSHKKPGQMTMIESQAMDMTAMKAPVGSVPVALEAVTRGRFEAAVTYAGSVVPFTEQEVYPRVEGYITSMVVYPGDEVRAGQVLARLDSPDVAQRIAAATDEAAAARENAAAAGHDTARMKQMVKSAAAELDAMRADLDYREAEYARMERLFNSGAISRSELDQERSMRAGAEAAVQRAEAELRAAERSRKASERQQQAMGTMAAASGRRLAARSEGP